MMRPMSRKSGPLVGTRVIEVGGMGPGPFCGMMLADYGAEVVRIDRPTEVAPSWPRPDGPDISKRGRRSVALDLKREQGRAVLLHMVERADVLIEPYRPGVAERLGFGPDVCLARNPRLIYGRMSGYGQDGPLARKAGHDINYLAVAGVLGALGPNDRPPTPPLNLIADFGGGGMLMTVAVLAALLERARSGEGQVIDCSMVEASALLLSHLSGAMQAGDEGGPRGTNQLDGGAPYYAVYETRDAEHIAFGAIEPAFYAEMLAGLGVDPQDLPPQYDRSHWRETTDRFAAIVRTRTQSEWEKVFAERDACFTSVVKPGAVREHPQNAARGSFVEQFGLVQAQAAPRFSRSAVRASEAPCHAGEHTLETLHDWGLREDELDGLAAAGAIRQAEPVERKRA